MRHPTARRLVAITLLTALMGCKLIDKIRNRGNSDADAGGSTTTVTVNPSTTPILVDGGGSVAIPLPNPTVAPNPTEIPTPDPDAGSPVAAPEDVGAAPALDNGGAAPPPVDNAATPPPPTGSPTTGTVPERIAACNQQHAADAPALAQCLQAIMPDATSTRDMATLAEAMYSNDNREARSAMRRDAMRLMDRYTRIVTRGSTYERFKNRLQGGR